MKVCVVVPNLNGKKMLSACLDSLKAQLSESAIILVDNGSSDGSADYVKQNYPSIKLIEHAQNRGFSGGVNAGIRLALAEGYDCIALFNNDAVAEKNWLKNLLGPLKANPQIGIVTSKILDKSERRLDSTGDIYSSWGLPFPRGRGETDEEQYDKDSWVFGASGGASLYRAEVFRQIGLFDEDFFAYYEDVDISFRAQLAGWKVWYQPAAIAYHAIGATSAKIPGFTTYQTFKNLPLLLWKNVPARLLPKIFLRFMVAYLSIYGSAVGRGQFGPATKGLLMSLVFWPKKLVQRLTIQRRRRVSAAYIDSIISQDLPPNAAKLRRLRYVLSFGRLKP